MALRRKPNIATVRFAVPENFAVPKNKDGWRAKLEGARIEICDEIVERQDEPEEPAHRHPSLIWTPATSAPRRPVRRLHAPSGRHPAPAADAS